jgi:uncharacterized pyridoxamine 5'-phosphate oxidase family protein
MLRKAFLVVASVVALASAHTASGIYPKIINKSENSMSNTDRVVKFLRDAKVFYIATVDGNQPRVRPFGVAANIDGKVSVCTGSTKNVAKQIKNNPNVEIVAMTTDGKWLRLTGVLVDITTTANQNKIFEVEPGLKSLYGKNIDTFRVLAFEEGTAIIQDMNGYKEVIELGK